MRLHRARKDLEAAVREAAPADLERLETLRRRHQEGGPGRASRMQAALWALEVALRSLEAGAQPPPDGGRGPPAPGLP